MKFKAFSLIEGIVSMILISLLLSIGILISFNLYKSFPSRQIVNLESVLKSQLDSLIAIRQTEHLEFIEKGCFIQYQSEPDGRFNNIQMANITGSDTLGNTIVFKKLYLSYEK